ncbi:hypothetical protein GIB67_001354 [Kingdonia uniflora]|uniref:P-type ATPase A domain-containing protein n=1 Tax=Kingdonia uniflora TaxID=39325 RepID=A0A7J7MTT5_9MAGN|nr:hypothetical protein GIB67_001354 [Kingdonia uniflora]
MQFKDLDREKKNIFVKVTRDGYSQTVPKTDLVVGDVVHLFTRDNISADGIYIYGSMLLIDESSLTGESDPVHGRLMDTLNEGGDDETPLQVKLNGVITIIAKLDVNLSNLEYLNKVLRLEALDASTNEDISKEVKICLDGEDRHNGYYSMFYHQKEATKKDIKVGVQTFQKVLPAS